MNLVGERKSTARRSTRRTWTSIVPSGSAASGFTLVELLVVMAIIAMMVAMMLPAVNMMRETARRTQCIGNVSHLITAVQNYEMAQEVYPMGVKNDTGPIRNEPLGFHHGWMEEILPYVEEKMTYRHIDRDVSVYDQKNRAARAIRIHSFLCPSAPDHPEAPAISCYAGVHHDVEAPIDEDNHGVFFLNRRLRYEDVTDGAAHTLFIGEKYIGKQRDLGWISGTRATLRNTGTPINMTDKKLPRRPGQRPVASQPAEAASLLLVGGFGSHHGGGAVFAFGDGNVEFLPVSIDQTVYQQMGHRADGKLINR